LLGGHRRRPSVFTRVPAQIALADYVRDINDVNKVYLPTVHKSYIYLRIGGGG